MKTKTNWISTDKGIMSRWLKCCKSSTRWLNFLPDSGLDDRLQRLFSVACCRRIWPLLKDERSKKAVDVAELFADGKVTEQELAAAAARASVAAAAARASVAAAAARASVAAADADAVADAADADAVAAGADAVAFEWEKQGGVLILFLAPEWDFDPQWNTSTVFALAQQIYESKDFSIMPILADALQDAGCENENLLLSLRNSDDPQWFRGCKILDCILGLR